MVFACVGTWRLVEELVPLKAILNEEVWFLDTKTAAFARAKAEYRGKHDQDPRAELTLTLAFDAFAAVSEI
jgi:hypothetical protein